MEGPTEESVEPLCCFLQRLAGLKSLPFKSAADARMDSKPEMYDVISAAVVPDAIRVVIQWEG